MKRLKFASAEHIQKFTHAAGARNPVEAVKKRAMELMVPLDSPPYQLDSLQIKRSLNVKAVRYVRDLVPDGRVSWDQNGYVIEIKSTLIAARRAFTLAHEIGHTFFLDHEEKEFASRADVATERFTSDDLEEYLCDVAASELLMPTKVFIDRVATYGPSVEAILKLAKEFGTSLSATARRFTDTNLWKCYVGFWRSFDANPPVFEFGFGSSGLGCIVNRGFVAAPRSAVAKAVNRGNMLQGMSDIGLITRVGESLGDVFVQALYLPRLRLVLSVAILEKHPQHLCGLIDSHKQRVNGSLSYRQISLFR